MPQKQTFTDLTPIQSGSQTFSDVTPIDGSSTSTPSVQLSNPSTVPNARIRNLPNPAANETSSAGALYHGMKTGAELASIPATMGQPLVPVVRGLIGGALGSWGAKKGAEILGADDMGQEIAGDVGGAITGGLASAAPGTRVGKSVGAISKPFATTIEDLPVVGSVIKGAKAIGNVRGELADIWAKQPPSTPPELTTPARTLPGQISPERIAPTNSQPAAPPVRRGLLLPAMTQSTIEQAVESPARTLPGQIPPERINPAEPSYMKPAEPIPQRGGLSLPPAPQGAELADLPATGARPAAQTGEALANAPRRGSIAGQMVDSVAKPQTSAPMQRGSLSQMMNQLQDQVGKGLGASPPPNPTKPIYQRGDLSSAMEGASDVPEGHTPVQSSALKSYKYDSSANEFHAKYGSGGDTVHVFGDVTPEEAQAFDQAQSKGQAMQQIKSSHPLVAKIINGKRTTVKPTPQ